VLYAVYTSTRMCSVCVVMLLYGVSKRWESNERDERAMKEMREQRKRWERERKGITFSHSLQSVVFIMRKRTVLRIAFIDR
jgi:hypothetical protein